MKQFLKNTTRYAVLVFAVFAIIELALLIVPNTYSYKRDYIENHLGDIKILLMGNSYIEEGLRADIIGSGCFNCAISGRDIVFDSEIARMYFAQMESLNAVVMPLDYSRFAFGRGVKNPKDRRLNIDGMTDTYRCMHYKYMNIHVDPFWFWSEILNSKLNYMERFIQDRQENVECDSLGYVPLSLSMRRDGWEYRALPPIIDTELPIDETEYNYMYTHFLTIAEMAKRKGAKLYIVDTPKYETYLTDVNEKVTEEIHHFIEKLRLRCANIEYLDFSDTGGFFPEDFNDACHLSDKGAVKFSEILKSRI